MNRPSSTPMAFHNVIFNKATFTRPDGSLGGLIGTIVDITERKRAEAETQEALQELERLYRIMSRESWQALQREVGPTGYQFDQTDVVPAEDFWTPAIKLAVERRALVPPATDQPIAVAPLAVHGEVIGALGVQDDPQHPLSPDDLALVEAVSEQVALALESARLFEQTQTALARTGALYEASRAVTAARDRTAIAEALVGHIDRTGLDRIVVALIVGTAEGQTLVEVQGVWDRAGQEQRFLGNRFTPIQIPLLAELGPRDILLVDDFATSTQVDETTRATFKYLGVRSAAILPISTGERVVGWLFLETTATTRRFTEEEMRPYMALVGQAAVVLESQRLLAETERRARREQLIREITTKIRASTDLDTILNTAVRELTINLGVSRTFVHLGVGPASEDQR